MTETSEASDVIERVQALTPFVEEHADKAEIDQKPVDEVISALEETGIFRAYVPRRFGGLELGPNALVDVGAAIAEACTSTGWVTTFYMDHNWMLSQFPESTQNEIFTKHPYILAPASIAPTGQARKVEGGYVLSGRWGWGTGVMHSNWVLLNGIVKSDPPDIRLFVVPRSDIQVEDTWDAAGMRGTGSHDMVAEELFVPEGYSESIPNMSIGRGAGAIAHGSPCYRVPMLPLLSMAAAAPAIGAARRAIRLFKDRLGSRTLYGTVSKQAERASAQMRLAHADVEVHNAETLLRCVGDELATWGEREEVCPTEDRARMRLQIAHVVRMCREAVRSLMEASGASAHLMSSPMQRVHRDIHTLSCHTVFDLDLASENYGRILIGLEPNAPV